MQPGPGEYQSDRAPGAGVWHDRARGHPPKVVKDGPYGRRKPRGSLLLTFHKATSRAAHLKQRHAERIRELCARLVNAPDCEWEPILTDLRGALHEHSEELRHLAATTLGARIEVEEES
jgi:hypothetical protein